MLTQTHNAILLLLSKMEPDHLTKDRLIAEELRLPREQVRLHVEQLKIEGMVEVEEILGTYYVRLTEDGRSEIASSP